MRHPRCAPRKQKMPMPGSAPRRPRFSASASAFLPRLRGRWRAKRSPRGQASKLAHAFRPQAPSLPSPASGGGLIAIVAVALILSAAPGRAELVAFKTVGDAIPASLTGGQGDAARGRAIVANHNTGLCLLCHLGPFPEDKFQGTMAPDLAGAGARWREGQLRVRIVDASKFNANTIMPPFYRVGGLNRVPAAYRGKPVLTAVEVEDVVAYLMTLK